MAGVAVGDDRREEVGALVRLGAGAHSRLPLASLVELQSLEELVDLVRHRVHRVVCGQDPQRERLGGCVRGVFCMEMGSGVPAKSGPGSLEVDAVEDDCQPDT